jgi:hypothetical protein
MANKTISLTLRIDAKYKDTIDYLKMKRGALTRVVEKALDKINIDDDVLRRMRELDTLAVEQIKKMLITDAYDEQTQVTKA